jgi:hypothetical protein
MLLAHGANPLIRVSVYFQGPIGKVISEQKCALPNNVNKKFSILR